MNLRHFEVGKLFEPGVISYPEGVKFDFTEGGLVLLLFFAGPTKEEVEVVRGGAFRIGFLEQGEIIFIVFKFEEIPWMDAPYTVHLSQPFDFMDIEKGTGYGLQVLLIDANTGILKVIRLVGLGTEWSRGFRAAVEKQKAGGFGQQIYDAKIQNIYRTYKTRDLIKMVEYKNWFKVSRTR